MGVSKISIKVEILFDEGLCSKSCPFISSDKFNGWECSGFGARVSLDKITNEEVQDGDIYFTQMPLRHQKCLDYEKQNANLRSTEVIENEKNTSSS